MRLAHIKLAGFKSFVDPTIIPVPGDLVGIVGPNGCGKSNVIDAVRWVLGESKASALRGESMQDVIFSGSANRKPVSRASVELTFDNKLGKTAGQWSSYAEISIKRVVHRDGDSIYYINNIRVRRRDIADLFLGTGVGGRGYAIIEQGMISRIIEAKPQELKLFLEEAAGVSRYRERRHETGLRLADTEKNLLRVEDICQELRKQLQHLETQAGVARQFKILQDKLHATQNYLWLAQKQQAIVQRTQAGKEIQQLELELEAEIAFLRKTEKIIEEIRTRHYQTSDELHQAQGKLYAANAEITNVEQEIKHLRENSKRLAQQILEAEQQLVQNNEQKKRAADNLVHWRQETEEACLTLESREQKHAIATGLLPAAETDFRRCQENLNSCQRNVLLIEQTQQLEESHHAHAIKIMQQLESRQARLTQEQVTLPQPDHGVLTCLRHKIEQTETIQLQKKSLLTQAKERLLTATKAKDLAAHKARLTQQELTQTQARFDALQRLQQQLESNQTLSAWFTRHQLDDLSRLWQNIQIEKGWENALEAVLRERLNSTGFEQLEIILEWIGDLPPGKWTLFESVQLSAQQNKTILNKEANNKLVHRKPIHEYLSYRDLTIKPILDEWLGRIYVVANLQAGLLQRDSLAPGETLVTPEGHIFSRYSLTFYTPDSQLHGVLSRQQELNQMHVEIKELKTTLDNEQSQLLAEEQTCSEINETITLLRHESELLQQQHHDSQLKMITLSQLTEQTDQRRNQIDTELVEIRQQLVTEALNKQNAQNKLAEQMIQIDMTKKQLHQEQLRWETADQLLTTQRQRVQDAKQEMQEAAFHEKTCLNKISETEQVLQAIEENIDRLSGSLEDLLATKNQINETNLNYQLQDCLSQRIKLEQTANETRNALENTANELQETEKSRLTAEHKLDPLRESLSNARLREQAARITENQFSQQLKEVEANEENLLPTLSEMQPTTLQADIQRLNAEIKALGAVNLAALDELQTLRIRETYLDSQLCDLKEAVITLENVIRQIDLETQERLLETFNAVNHNLNKIFPVIFGGGQAKLILNSDEIIESGIQLTAQPPGKKNSSIHLLSGGEKALTALALVFSLFQLNPAPFCLLDEVDAPLDDSNTGRFCDLVKKMSNQTQFLFISHNKITMEMAQQLIGVTMQEQGVSRIVAVDIEEAIRLNEALVV
ncbi:MAG: chromosome segregation protein SMC [Nitrosomonas sp.]|nr:chromosome segregation protein SMC [Nitrosomonas sp.]MDP1950485.1 chromosome segregation protein SMC [Nitrosomonas sp.]